MRLEFAFSLIITLSSIIISIPRELKYLFSLNPALIEELTPNWDKYSIVPIQMGIQRFFDVSCLKIVNNLEKKQENSDDSWYKQPWLIMKQKGELKCCFFSIIAFYNIYGIKMIFPCIFDESSK